ncbi:hypothetical protein E1A91_A12G064300v1 [Gossypium mustelinum]|uniref:Transmembrane protein n=1 Tax=Gossypium mustelinum TaxID=34275 RepID=A0A5D2WSI0_GOSMU|nr:hypothetical protein E1A91_A12G064300v1 [Gossypium mustelinum]
MRNSINKSLAICRLKLYHQRRPYRKRMSDWGPIFVALVLFVLLTPGLLFQVPGHHRCVEFGNFKTSGASILIHSLLYFGLICVFLLAIKVHLHLG